jgi:hypothetical protein
MKSKVPQSHSGKTLFHRIKKSGQSWLEARELAIKAGKWVPEKSSSITK